MPESKNGSSTSRTGTVTTRAGNVFAIVNNGQVNKDGADTSFPLNKCVEVVYKDNLIFAKNWKGKWFQFIGGSWWSGFRDPRSM